MNILDLIYSMYHTNNSRNICSHAWHMDQDLQKSLSKLNNTTRACNVGCQMRIKLSSCCMHILQSHIMECINHDMKTLSKKSTKGKVIYCTVLMQSARDHIRITWRLPCGTLRKRGDDVPERWEAHIVGWMFAFCLLISWDVYFIVLSIEVLSTS